MKINSKLFGFLPLLSVLLFLSIFYLWNSKEIKLLKDASEKVIEIFNDDHNIIGISHYSVWLRGDKFFCPLIQYAKDECKSKILQYRGVQNKIPDDFTFYNCDGGFIIRTNNEKYYELWIHSRGNIIDSGVDFRSNINGWISYYHGLDKFDLEPCYPWDNLEDYWSRHGKATPDQIQAVIDEGV